MANNDPHHGGTPFSNVFILHWVIIDITGTVALVPVVSLVTDNIVAKDRPDSMCIHICC